MEVPQISQAASSAGISERCSRDVAGRAATALIARRPELIPRSTQPIPALEDRHLHEDGNDGPFTL